MITMRLRSRVSDAELATKTGRILGERDYNALLTGPARLLKPNGDPLCVYLPGELAALADDPEVYRVLHSLRTQTTDNRGMASGSRRIAEAAGVSTRAKPVRSAVVGALEATGRRKYCRLTSWTGQNLPDWQTLRPLLEAISGRLQLHVPDRWAAQHAAAAACDPGWIVPGTVFSTITVNNTYPTGVHTDAGDYAPGFSSIACLRKGTYTGGRLVFPRWRVAVDLQHGDLLLMDAHEWHGNTRITCACGHHLDRDCTTCGAERISVVSYLREKMPTCGTPAEETARAAALADARSGMGGPS